LKDDQTSLPEGAEQRTQVCGGVAPIHKNHAANDRVEVTSERAVRDRRLKEFDIRYLAESGTLSGEGDDLRRLINADNVSFRPNDVPRQEREISGAAADVEDAHPRRESGFK
jgi:hypothetical protein